MEATFPYLTADLAAVPVVFKARDEDFLVEELPAYAASGAGDHVYFAIEKRGLTTHEAIHRLADALGVAPRAIGYAGLKDARGVTRQVLSLEHVDPGRVSALALERIAVLWVSRHTNKLRRGHLRGNRFALKLRGEAAAREAEVRAVLERLERTGLPNYFGEQRFGLRGQNWRIGRALLRGEHAEAAAWMAGRPAAEGPGQDTGAVLRARQLFEAGDYQGAARTWPGRFRSAVRLCRAMHKTRDARKALRSVGGEELRFCVAAYQSRLFNRVVGARLAGGGLGTLLAGDLAWRHAGGAVFRVEDPAREQPRADSLEISASGPLFGRRMTRPAGEPDRIEQGVLAEEGQAFEDFLRAGPFQWKGARRPLRVPLGEPALSAEEDEHGPYLALGFVLAAGSYATAVLREIAKDR